MKTPDKWTRVSDDLPPNGEVVEIKIDDAEGCRNQCYLRRENNLWFSGGMYVYYAPTHWRRNCRRSGSDRRHSERRKGAPFARVCNREPGDRRHSRNRRKP
jgi:hypothetical protein